MMIVIENSNLYLSLMNVVMMVDGLNEKIAPPTMLMVEIQAWLVMYDLDDDDDFLNGNLNFDATRNG